MWWFFSPAAGGDVESSSWAVLAGGEIDWPAGEERFCWLYSEEGRPGVPIWLMVGFHDLKHTFDRSDKAMVKCWVSILAIFLQGKNISGINCQFTQARWRGFETALEWKAVTCWILRWLQELPHRPLQRNRCQKWSWIRQFLICIFCSSCLLFVIILISVGSIPRSLGRKLVKNHQLRTLSRPGGLMPIDKDYWNCNLFASILSHSVIANSRVFHR